MWVFICVSVCGWCCELYFSLDFTPLQINKKFIEAMAQRIEEKIFTNDTSFIMEGNIWKNKLCKKDHE